MHHYQNIVKETWQYSTASSTEAQKVLDLQTTINSTVRFYSDYFCFLFDPHNSEKKRIHYFKPKKCGFRNEKPEIFKLEIPCSRKNIKIYTPITEQIVCAL